MRSFSLLILIFICSHLNGQSPFTIYNTENSEIPSNLVHVIYVDTDQNKWIGTENGLVKIDTDDNWTVYNTDNSGLPENDIRAIFNDVEDSTLWIGTFLHGLVKYDTVWTIYDPANSPIPDYQIRAITKDQNDTMWIGSLGGLTKWDGLDNWFTYDPDNSPLLSNNIPKIYVGENNVKYMGTINGGLATYDNGIINTYKTTNSLISDNTVLGIDEDIDHNIWLATSFGGLSVLTPDTTFLKFTPSTSDIVDWSLDDLVIDNDNIAAIAMTSEGLEIFDNMTWALFDTLNSELPDDFLNCVAVDEQNRIWIGTESKGLVIFDRTLIDNITEKNNLSLFIYPNPSTDHVLISGEIAGSEMVIFNMEGKIISENKIVTNTEFIDVSNLISGNYIIKIIKEKAISISRISVMH